MGAQRNGWIELQLVDESGAPVAGELVEIAAPDHFTYLAQTDAAGLVRLEGIGEGASEVSFIDRDGSAWELRSPAPRSTPRPRH